EGRYDANELDQDSRWRITAHLLVGQPSQDSTPGRTVPLLRERGSEGRALPRTTFARGLRRARSNCAGVCRTCSPSPVSPTLPGTSVTGGVPGGSLEARAPWG